MSLYLASIITIIATIAMYLQKTIRNKRKLSHSTFLYTLPYDTIYLPVEVKINGHKQLLTLTNINQHN